MFQVLRFKNMQTLTLPLSFSAKMPSMASRGLIFKIIFAMSLLSFMSLLTLYVIQMGDLTGKSFILNSFEAEAEELSGDNVNLHTTAGSHYSLQDMESRINQLNFVRVGDISYIPIYPEQLVSNVQ